MKTLTTTAELAQFCKRAAQCDFVTIDTEFLRERTYYSKLCLIQMAVPDGQADDAVLIDTLSDNLSLDPLYDLFRDTGVVKVFHAARQDLEIFYVQGGVFPDPLFDTQIAAMVCGFGEQVGYDTLVRKITRETIDKSSRFTDWSRRPLSEDQKNYAIADVTHLRDVYTHLEKRIRKDRRISWVKEELSVMTDPATYVVEPENAWKRVKTRSHSGKFLATVKELAAFRESYAQSHNVPRTRVYKDDALLELASTKPRNHSDLSKSRLLLREARKGEIAEGIIKSVERAAAYKPEDYPKIERKKPRENGNQGLADLLRVLLKAKAEQSNVAQRLIASSSDLDDIAAGERDVHALAGWRAKLFGNDALRLCNGEIALSANGSSVKIVEL